MLAVLRPVLTLVCPVTWIVAESSLLMLGRLRLVRLTLGSRLRAARS